MKTRKYMPWPIFLWFAWFYMVAVPAFAETLPATIDAMTIDTSYCKGWEDGYCEGWKDVKGVYAICPIAPICPIPEIDKDRYRDAYNRGFKTGRKDAIK